MESYASNEPRIGIVKTAVGIAAFIIAYVTKCPVIYVFSLLSPGSS